MDWKPLPVPANATDGIYLFASAFCMAVGKYPEMDFRFKSSGKKQGTSLLP